MMTKNMYLETPGIFIFSNLNENINYVCINNVVFKL